MGMQGQKLDGNTMKALRDKGVKSFHGESLDRSPTEEFFVSESPVWEYGYYDEKLKQLRRFIVEKGIEREVPA